MSRSSSHRALALAALVASLAVVPASADVFKAPLSAAKPQFAWSGHGVGFSAAGCSNEGGLRCDSVVFALDVAGDLTVTVDVEGEQITNPAGAGAYPDFSLHLFKSDAEGVKQGDAIAEASTPADDEQLVAPKLAAGTYVMEVHSDLSIGEDYAGKARLSNFALPPAPVLPAATPPPPAAAPAPAAKPRPSPRARCRAKARKLKGKSRRARALRRCSTLTR